MGAREFGKARQRYHSLQYRAGRANCCGRYDGHGGAKMVSGNGLSSIAEPLDGLRGQFSIATTKALPPPQFCPSHPGFLEEDDLSQYPHRIAIVEDSMLLREGLVRLIEEAGFFVAGAFADGDKFKQALPTLELDLVVMDVRMPPTFTDEGLKVAIALRQERPRFPVLILSQFVESLYAQELFADGQGFLGYLLKDRVVAIDAFYEAIQKIASGGTVLDPEVVSALLKVRQDPLQSLTPRERDVMGAMAEGLTNAAIALRFDISAGTVEKHISTIFSKLGLFDDQQEHRRVLAVLAWLRGH